jgi:hypothetical protein
MLRVIIYLEVCVIRDRIVGSHHLSRGWVLGSRV